MISPCLLVTIAQASQQDPSPNINIFDYVMNGGIAGVVLVIWYLTFRYMLKQHEETIKRYDELVKETKKEYQELIKNENNNYSFVIEKFISIYKEGMQLNNYVMGALKEMIGKLDQVLKNK